ncbi:hypothetical protein HELRODRAFT_194898 [Helobdella robusta]|uniref:C-factor n=1 Tax=Helobdella robusta TaxID=6412 RepID=T1FWJ4_HELRO|nr:hypothetical protein HELRODRAFT_194898 [Helobdella robusta]ESO11117.1 hypothetical protein HELRODRAFT_194898 [Helobdella robusta]
MEASLAAKSIFLTGCSRGIGLEFVKQLLKLPNKPKYIFATCRDVEKANELKDLAKKNPEVYLHNLDVTDFESFPSVVSWVKEKVGDGGLNLLINNAGIFDVSALDVISREKMKQSFEVNCVAPLMLARAFVPLLKKASSAAGGDNGMMSCSKACIVNVTSRMGSIEDNTSGGHYSYRASKAALNMVSKSLSVDLKSAGILVGVVHPGWVQTDMGGANALITTEVSVKGLIKVLSSLNQSDAGFFKSFDGSTIPW